MLSQNLSNSIQNWSRILYGVSDSSFGWSRIKTVNETVSNTVSDKNLYQKINENDFRIKNKKSIWLRISELYVHFQKLYVQFHLSDSVSDRTEKIRSGLNST